MDSQSPNLADKVENLMRYPDSFKKKPANLRNLKTVTKLIRYVLKYLNKYPSEFRKVFCAYLDFVKDFITRCDTSLQIQCVTQISVVLLHTLRINFDPLLDLEDILEHWIEILVAVPAEITAIIVERNTPRINFLTKSLKFVGHYKLQTLLVEILVRYLFSLEEEEKAKTVKEFFSKEKGCEILIDLLINFDTFNLESSIRKFLIEFNTVFKTNVVSYGLRSISADEISINPPTGFYKQWIDMNLRARSVSFYGNSSVMLWNYFETPVDSIAHVSKGMSLTLDLELTEKLHMAFCDDDTEHLKYGDILNLQIKFYNNVDRDEFYTTLQTLLNSSSEPLELVQEPNESVNTLNLSMVSHQSFHNGRLDARFSFRANEDDETDEETTAEKVNEEREVVVVSQPRQLQAHIRSISRRLSTHQRVVDDAVPGPSKTVEPIFAPQRTTLKRKLYSGDAYDAIIPPTQETEVRPLSPAESEQSLQIVMYEEDLAEKRQEKAKPPPPVAPVAPSQSSTRVPIYRSVVEDWTSQGDPYEFVSNDPPTAQKPSARNRKRPAVSLGNFTRKTVPLKRQRATLGVVSARKNASVTKKGPVYKKAPLDFVKKIIKRPCKEAAQEAKRVFNLQKTPPYHGRAVQETSIELPEEPQNTINGLTYPVETDEPFADIQRRCRVSEQSERSSQEEFPSAMGELRPSENRIGGEGDEESYAVFMKCIEEYRTLSLQMSEVMKSFRKLKQKIIHSNKLSEYQKAGLLVELCNFLLKK